jgi:2-oxoglutarate ferredoxin oxidoreductase subunit beta
LVEAIGHPGLAFVHVLNPCQTFRPEQKTWKKEVQSWPERPTEDPAEAARRI